MSESEYDSSESPSYGGRETSPESEEEEQYGAVEAVEDDRPTVTDGDPAQAVEPARGESGVEEGQGDGGGEKEQPQEEEETKTESALPTMSSDESEDEIGTVADSAVQQVMEHVSGSEDESTVKKGMEGVGDGGEGGSEGGGEDVWAGEEGDEEGGKERVAEGREEGGQQVEGHEVVEEVTEVSKDKDESASAVDMEGVFDSSDGEEQELPEVTGPGDKEDSPVRKKARFGDDGEEEEGGASELQAAADEGVGMAMVEVGDEEDKDSDEESPATTLGGSSDWDQMMQRRKDAMARARKKRRRNYDVTLHDDDIMAMIHQMKHSAQEDRRLNLERRPATKKLQMLPTVVTHLKKSDLQTSFIECGILTGLADWLQPLPDHSLPHLKIRESILSILRTYPTPDSGLLKSSKIGKAVMLLYRHPKETKKNKEVAGKLVNDWARPIFGLASDFKSLSRDEREERDYAHLSQAARRRLSSGSERRGTTEEENEPQKPGDRGWISRARVPMPSTKDYVVRPKWNVEQEYKKASSKKVMNRYDKQVQKHKQKQQTSHSTHAVSISVEGRNMPL